MKNNRILFAFFIFVLSFVVSEFTSLPCSPISGAGSPVQAAEAGTNGNGAEAAIGITDPGDHERVITSSVTYLLQKEHISKRPIDAEISKRTLSNLFKALDPQKLYFYQADIEQFAQYEPNLGAWFREGSSQFAYAVFKAYLSRLETHIGVMLELLDEPIDFTVDEEMVTDRDSLRYSLTKNEARERLRKRVKYDLLLLQMDDLIDQKNGKKDEKKDDAADESQAEKKAEGPAKTPAEKHKEAVEKLKKRYTSLLKRMRQVDSDDLLEIYLTSMTSSFDPHTSYMSARTLENFEIMMRLELDGIGASLMSDDGYVVVKSLVPGGAADKEGTLKIDDKICGVGQGPEGPVEDIVDMKLDDVVKKVRGKRGTIVRLEVIPADGSSKKIVQIIRAKIELKDSEAKGEVFEAGKKADGSPYKLGVINLPSFYMDMEGVKMGNRDYKSTTRDVRKILQGFKADGVDAVILDLRNNGGGSLPEAISTTGLFIKSGAVVQVKDAYGKVMPHRDDDVTMDWDGPLVVVTNKLSASASEILAGAIQDYHRGLIIGDKTTHGKGTVQTLTNIGWELVRSQGAKLGALKVTMQQFYRPLGDSTQFRGVESDIEIPAITTHMDIGEGDLDYAMPFDKVAPQKIDNYQYTNPDVIRALKTNSEARVAASDDFKKLQKKIDFYCNMKERKTVSLNAEKFLSERSDMIDDEEKKLEDKVMRSANEIKRDFYLDEVMNITLDYMRAFGK